MQRISAEDTKKVRRKGRKLVGISPEHYRRLTRLRYTNKGILAVSAVASAVIELGLKSLEGEK